MKKMLALLLTGLMLLSLCACGKTNEQASTEANLTEPAPTEPEPTTAADALSEKEKELFDILIKIVTDDFYEPSAVRILELSTPEIILFRSGDLALPPRLIAVRLQGENLVGGTLNHWYVICVEGGENNTYSNSFYESKMEEYKRYGKGSDKATAMGEKATRGEYVEIEDDAVNSTIHNKLISNKIYDGYDVGRINKAIIEYWKDRGIG